MLKKALILVLFLISSTPAFAQVSKKLMGLAMKGHGAFMDHGFVVSLRNPNEFRREQVAQFLQDRVYILKILEEKIALKDMDEETNSFFFRSTAYQQDLYNLVGKWVTYPESEAARRYGEYVQKLDAKSAALNVWLFLVGETFGTQSMCKNILKKFPRVGRAVMTFGKHESPRIVAGKFNEWIDGELKEDDLNFEAETATVYDYSLKTFDAALDAPRVRRCGSVGTFLSETCFQLTGY